MYIDALHMHQDPAVKAVPSVAPAAGPSSSASRERYGSGLFGPAYVREGRHVFGESFPLYGADGRLRKDARASGEEDLADARAVKKLEARDRRVRREEEAKGEAVGGRNYIYRTGPDGRQYAVGTAAHVVLPEENIGGEATTVGPGGEKLSRTDQALIEKLNARDAKVRNHEAAHVMAAGGQSRGMPVYTYQTGPDGRRYAVGGSVNIAVTATGDAEQDARQARNLQRAALAAGEPSSRDMQTALAARAKEADAHRRQWSAALNAYERQGAMVYA